MSSSTIVLVTGANSGVGYAITQVLATSSQTYHIIMAGRSPQKLTAAANDLHKSDLKGSISTLTMDVTDEKSIATAAAQVEKDFGRVDVLINNAGIASTAPDKRTEYTEVLASNVIGPILVTDAFEHLLLKSKDARIIHVSSGLGSLKRASEPLDSSHDADFTSYRVSKAALNMFMVQNAKQLKGKGVKVFGLCPGLVRSNLRGNSEEQVSAGGRAMDPEVSGRLVRDVIEGQRDGEVGRVVKFEGSWEW